MTRSETIERALRGAAAVALLPLLGGCAAIGLGPAPDPEGLALTTHGTLVLPPPKLSTHWDVPPYEDSWDWGWEHYRNDDALGIGRSSGLVQTQQVEVRGVDRRSSHNGRVTESSRTTTRTLRRGWLLTR